MYSNHQKKSKLYFYSVFFDYKPFGSAVWYNNGCKHVYDYHFGEGSSKLRAILNFSNEM